MLAPRKSNTTALEIFDGQLRQTPVISTTAPKIVSVKASSVEAGKQLNFWITFDQKIRGFTIADIEMTAPAQLVTWLSNGYVYHAGGPKDRIWCLVYDVSPDFDDSLLPADYALVISIRSGGIQGEGS